MILIQFKKLHGDFFWIYRIYYKLLKLYLQEDCPKSEYHDLVHGPQTIGFNCDLLHNLLDVLFVQIGNIYHMVLTKYVLAVQDNTTMVGI